jgi:hypothetical protein
MKKFFCVLVLLPCLAGGDVVRVSEVKSVVGKYRSGGNVDLEIKANGKFVQAFHVIRHTKFGGTWTCAGDEVELTFKDKTYGVVKYTRVGEDTLREFGGKMVFVRVR